MNCEYSIELNQITKKIKRNYSIINVLRVYSKKKSVLNTKKTLHAWDKVRKSKRLDQDLFCAFQRPFSICFSHSRKISFCTGWGEKWRASSAFLFVYKMVQRYEQSHKRNKPKKKCDKDQVEFDVFCDIFVVLFHVICNLNSNLTDLCLSRLYIGVFLWFVPIRFSIHSFV